MKIGCVFIGLTGLMALGGCQPQLETGYVPRQLNASEADRKAYYAPEFSPEAHASKDSSGTGFNFGH